MNPIPENASFGPILYALGEHNDGRLHYRLLCAHPTQPELDTQTGCHTAQHLLAFMKTHFWVFTLVVQQHDQPFLFEYSLLGKTFCFSVPGRSETCLRIAYSACNGSEAETPEDPLPPRRNVLWQDMWNVHQQQPFCLLIQGGDQLYADSVWRRIPFLKAWQSLPRSQQYSEPLPDVVFEQIRQHYFACYMAWWSVSPVREVLASIPSLMIWDDHDIFDGWGSWNVQFQNSPVYQGIFKAAREAFYIFQRGCMPPETPIASMAFSLGSSIFVAPDLRSERTRQIVMGPYGRAWLNETLKHHRQKKHLIFVSSVPLATSHFSALDPLLTGFPSALARRLPKHLNPKQFADDIYDQWRVPAHRAEWIALLTTLLDFADETGTRVTTLSGEIHLGARSTIRRNQTTIHQFISSGIAHKPASPAAVWFCELLSKGTQDISEDIDIRMEYFFPDGKKRYLRSRNWLSLMLHSDASLEALWHAEDAPAIIFKD